MTIMLMNMIKTIMTSGAIMVIKTMIIWAITIARTSMAPETIKPTMTDTHKTSDTRTTTIATMAPENTRTTRLLGLYDHCEEYQDD